MAYPENPILKNIETGNNIQVNSSPFTIGRGLICNFVIPSTVVSRKHCYLEKIEERSWVLHDTSTNGTYLNGTLIKSSRSPPLQEKDVIGLNVETEQYVFHFTPPQDDISDEQLCMIADSVLQGVEVVTEDVIIEPIENVITIPSDLPQDNHNNKACSGDESVIFIENTENGLPPRKKNCSESSKINSIEIPTTNEAGTSKTENVQEAAISTHTAQDNIDEMEDEMQCSICSEMFVKATTLNCAHTFCKYCIETWKKNKSECPICRCRITSLTSTLVLDNLIEKVIQNMPAEMREHRKELLEDRKKEELKNRAPPPAPDSRRNDRRGRRGNNRRGNDRRGNDRRGNNRRGDRDIHRGPYMPATVPPPPLLYASVPQNVPQSTNSASVVPTTTTNLAQTSVIELDSSSESSESVSETTDSEAWRDEYDQDEWYGDGIPGAYYGGYGHCYQCGSTGHWRNGCPYR